MIVIREAQSIHEGTAPFVVIERVAPSDKTGGRIAMSRADALRLLDDLTELVGHWA